MTRVVDDQLLQEVARRVLTVVHVEESKAVFGRLAYRANKYGRVIYEAA